MMKYTPLRSVIALSLACLFAGSRTVAQLPAAVPEVAGLDEKHLDHIDKLVAEEIEKGQLPGCVVMIGRRGCVAFARAYGDRQLEPTREKMTLDTLFDMASLTKPMATATSIMILFERGVVRLRDPVAEHIPEFAQNGKDEITIEHLLTHQGGLIPDNPLADYQHGADEAWKRIWALKPTAAIGEKFIYTDVGFLVLAEVIRRTTDQDVAEFAAENIYRPLGMNDTGYRPPQALHARAAPSEQRDGRWLKGEVHDPRAALLDGIAGHAGLFSTANDLAIYADMMLAGGARVMSEHTIAEMLRPRDVAGHSRALGWDVQSKYSSNRGELFSQQAFGHGGFTGTAMWIDPGLDLFVIFLSNRLHPDGEGSVNQLAGRIGTVAAAAIRDAPQSREPTPTSQPTLLGIDVLERDNFCALAGRRVGLITNHTGLNRRGERTIDLLAASPQVELVALFSPEHGLEGKLDVAKIDDARDHQTGLPIYSLYGKSRRPESKQLEGIDTLVFDIQDIGARFYTYISTMGHAMEVAAENKLQFVVLDRPNPINGVDVAGPVRDEGEENESFVAYHTIPVRHGMTVGELAAMFRDERGWDLDLVVVPLENWRRGDYWDATGLTWINPSPNMRSLTQAVLYPGIGLLETTNVSVGRGTDTPFEVIGAPWIDEQQLARELNGAALPGVRFVPIRFTPDVSKFAGELCHGVNVVIVDRDAVRPVDVGLEIACSLRRLYPDVWEIKRFNRLLVNQSVYEAIREGKSRDELHAQFNRGLQDFLPRRARYLRYAE